MFRLLKLKPPNGWNAVAWELLIVTVGVLLALGAQQLVERWQARREVAGFRNAVRDEIETNLDSYPYRAKQKACIDRRLNQLQAWLDGWRAGRGVALTEPIGVVASRVIRTSVWDSTDPATVANLPLAERIEYSHLYSEFANNEVHRLDERETWFSLQAFEGATMLDHQDQMRLQGLITRARLRDDRIDANAARFLKRAADRSGLRPKPIVDPPAYDERLCQPILTTAAS